MQCAPRPRTPSSIAIPYHFGSGPSGTLLSSSVSTQVGVLCFFQGWRGVAAAGIVCRSQLVTIINRFWPQSIDSGAKQGKNTVFPYTAILSVLIQPDHFTVISIYCVFGQKWSILAGRKNGKVPYHLRKSDDYHTDLHTKNGKVPYHGHSRYRH